MDIFFTYLLKVNVIVSVLFVAWYFLFRKEKFLDQNRFVLLGILFSAFLLPLIPSAGYTHTGKESIVTSLQLQGYKNASAGVPADSAKENPAYPVLTSPNRINLLSLAGILYVSVTALLLLRFINQLVNVFIIINKSDRRSADGVVYCEPAKDLPPFSFFNFIVVNRKAVDDSRYLQIISHEYVHFEQWHSADVVLCELARIILWMNPLMLLLKRSVKLNLEFIADDRVVHSGVDQRNYQLNLLYSTLNDQANGLTNPYASPAIKKRISMMNTERPMRRKLRKYITLVPLLLMSYFLIAPLSAQTSGRKDATTIAGHTAEMAAMTGLYGLKYHHDIRILISSKDGSLVLEQLWDKQKIVFTRKSRLEYYNEEKKFPLKFVEEKDGTIKGFVAFGKDTWGKFRKDRNVKRKSN